MASLKIQNAEYEKQPGGKGVGKNCSLESRPYYNEDAHHCADKTGRFGFTIAEEKQADRNPHNADQNQKS
jgi:hypothetical protein